MLCNTKKNNLLTVHCDKLFNNQFLSAIIAHQSHWSSKTEENAFRKF